MGCFYGTCAITNLPISMNDDVCGYFVALPNELPLIISSGVCHSTDYGWPISPLITGKYDDYGFIENPVYSSEAMNLFFECYNIKSFDEAVKMLHGHEPHKYSNMFPPIRVGLWMAHKKAFDYILHDVTNDWDYKKITYESLIEMSNDFLIKTDEIMSTCTDRHERFTKHHELSMSNPFIRHISSEYNVFSPLKSVLAGISFNDFDKNAYTILAKECVMLLRIMLSLDALRKVFIPQSGGGSQDTNYESYSNLAKLTLQIIEDRKKEMEEWEEDM